MARCSPASPGWRALVLRKIARVIDEWGTDGIYVDGGYLMNRHAAKRAMPPAADEIAAFTETPEEDGAFEAESGLPAITLNREMLIYAVIGIAAIAILIGVYKLGLSINEVSAQAAALSDLLPRAAQTIFHDEIARQGNGPRAQQHLWLRAAVRRHRHGGHVCQRTSPQEHFPVYSKPARS